MPVIQIIIDDSTSKIITGTYEFDRANGGTLLVPSGSAFPGTPAAKELFWRTDEAKLYRRDDANATWEAVQATAAAHATSHKSGGADSIKLDELAAPTDVVTLNVSTGAHGLTPKLPNDSGKFLDGTGAWAVPPSGGMSEAQHKVLRQLIHFIDGGPAEGFTSGAYREVTGTVFPSAIIWYDQAGAGKKKIVEKTIGYTGAFPTTVTWKVYDAAETLLATVSDAITYSGPFETSRTRTIS